MKIRSFVFDTNSLISALILPSSISRLCLEKADKLGQLVFSEETLNELNEVIIRSKFDKYVSLSDRLEYIEKLEVRGRIVETSSNFSDCRDVKDNKFLNLAYDTESSFIITGDNDLLVLHPYKEIEILTPADFYKIHLDTLK
jgi:putative PIN family toxin of toxin-antitoxin system